MSRGLGDVYKRQLVMGRFLEMELIGGKVRAVHVGERMRRILVMSGVTRVIEVEEEKTWK